MKWTLQGYDAFSDEGYPLPGEFDTREEAFAAGRKRLAELEGTQPSADSGGQSFFGIQDRVYVVTPTGRLLRVLAHSTGYDPPIQNLPYR